MYNTLLLSSRRRFPVSHALQYSLSGGHVFLSEVVVDVTDDGGEGEEEPAANHADRNKTRPVTETGSYDLQTYQLSIFRRSRVPAAVELSCRACDTSWLCDKVVVACSSCYDLNTAVLECDTPVLHLCLLSAI